MHVFKAVMLSFKHWKGHQVFLNIWLQRDLTPICRVTIVEALGLSQLVFLFLISCIFPPYLLKSLQPLTFHLIWAGRPDNVKRSMLNGPYNQGVRGLHTFKVLFVNCF